MSTGLFKNINDLYYKTDYISIKDTILFLLIIINGIILFSFSREDLKKINAYKTPKDDNNHQVWSKHNQIILNNFNLKNSFL